MALVAPVLALLVFATIDLGRAYSLQSRLSNAAREGAAVLQAFPGNVDTGCGGAYGDRNATDQAKKEDLGLSRFAGYKVTVAKRVGSSLVPYTGCGTATLSSGDHVVVTVQANFHPVTPFARAITGDPVTITRSSEVVVQ